MMPALPTSLNQLPRDYEHLVATGRATWPGEAHLDALDAEWIPQPRLGDPKLFFCEPIPNLLPFARSAGHDLWCWRLDVPTGEREFEVLYCPRDSEVGKRWSPTFATWAFRKAVEEAVSLWDPEDESREHLTAWATVLRELSHNDLANVIEEISKRPLLEVTPGADCFVDFAEYEELVARYVGKEFWNAPYRWMANG